MNPKRTLSLLVEQYRQKHHKLPEKIIVHPIAAVVLCARKSLGPMWQGIPVVIEHTKPKGLEGKPATTLGVIVNGSALQGFDL